MEDIEYLIELDFDGERTHKSGIIINQANRDSVIFNFKITKGANEINYSNYTRAEMVFQNVKSESVIDDARMNSAGISYTLNKYVFGVVGNVLGQINLYKENTVSATLHYDFLLIRDLANVEQMSKFYVRTIEEIIADMGKIIQQRLIDNTTEIEKLKNEIISKVNDAKNTILYLQNNAIDVHDGFIDKLNTLENVIDTVIDDLITQTEDRANDWIETLRAEFERQHAAMEDIVAGDFTTNALFNRHRYNGDADAQHITAIHKLNQPIIHNLNRFPMIQILRVENAFGRGVFGETPFNGNNISVVAKWEHINRNSFDIYLPEVLTGVSITQIENKFIISSDTAVYHVLIY